MRAAKQGNRLNGSQDANRGRDGFAKCKAQRKQFGSAHTNIRQKYAIDRQKIHRIYIICIRTF